MKGDDGEPRVIDLHGIEFVPTFADGPQWPVVTPGPMVKLPAAPRQARPVVGFQTCVVLPDIQLGYFRTASNDLEAIHDEAAISVALQIVKAVKPSLIVLVGDNLDLCEFGKYRTSPPFQRTTQAAIDRATVLCAQLRLRHPTRGSCGSPATMRNGCRTSSWTTPLRRSGYGRATRPSRGR